MNIHVFRDNIPEIGNTIKAKQDDGKIVTVTVKEIHDYGRWIHIIDTNDFNWTHSNITEV